LDKVVGPLGDDFVNAAAAQPDQLDRPALDFFE
jgi:hypothetical protein